MNINVAYRRTCVELPRTESPAAGSPRNGCRVQAPVYMCLYCWSIPNETLLVPRDVASFTCCPSTSTSDDHHRSLSNAWGPQTSKGMSPLGPSSDLPARCLARLTTSPGNQMRRSLEKKCCRTQTLNLEVAEGRVGINHHLTWYQCERFTGTVPHLILPLAPQHQRSTGHHFFIESLVSITLYKLTKGTYPS